MCVFRKYIVTLGGAGEGEVDAEAPKLGVVPPKKVIKPQLGAPILLVRANLAAGDVPPRRSCLRTRCPLVRLRLIKAFGY